MAVLKDAVSLKEKGYATMAKYFCDAYASWQKGGVENARLSLQTVCVHGMFPAN